MKNPDNDNELFPFTTLGAATLNVVRWLEKDRDQEPSGGSDKAPENEADRQREHERAVEAGLRRIRLFEDRYSRDRARR
jgi:hypothetical protein